MSEEGLFFKRSTFKEVCEHFGIKDALIPSKASENELECMGRNFSITKFCEDKFKDDLTYTRARFNIDGNEVNCHFSKTSIVEIECSEEHIAFCQNPEKTCNTIKPRFALNHDFTNAILIEKKPLILKCFYQSKEKIPQI